MYYQVSQQALDRTLAKNLKISRKAKKVVKVCLHSSVTVQISLQFDEFFEKKNFKILIFIKTSHLKLDGTP